MCVYFFKFLFINLFEWWEAGILYDWVGGDVERVGRVE